MPFFSVVIPLYNKERFVENTLRSVLAQTFTNFEVIVVNDGSTDQSEAIVHAFDDSRIRYFSMANAGVSAARNFGISVAESDYIAFLDADDYWYADFLTTLHDSIMAFPDQAVFTGAYEIQTGTRTIPARYSIAVTQMQTVDFFEASLRDCIIWTSCAVFHKTVFEQVGNFDVTLKRIQDTDLWIRIGLRFPVVFCPKIVARYSFDENGLSQVADLSTEPLHFSAYEKAATENPRLRQFLDLNRYALAIKSKLKKDKSAFRGFYNGIQRERLPLRKRILLELPGSWLRKLVRLQRFLAANGLAKSVLK